MANRIKELGGLSVGSGSGGPIESVRPAAPVGSVGAGTSPAGDSDSVQITPYARLLTSLSQAVQNAPEVDAARVSSLQQAIDSGQYQVDAEKIAARLLSLEQDLGETHSQ